MSETTEQVEAILWAENHTNLCGCKQWPDECVTYPGGAKAIHFTVSTEDVLRVATELIVAAIRRQDRDLLVSVLFHHHKKTRTDSDGINGRCVCGWGRPGDAFPLHIADELDAAIARGHVGNRPQIAPAAPTAPPEGVRTSEDHGDAQEAVG